MRLILALVEAILGMGTRNFWLRVFETFSYGLAFFIPGAARRNLNVIRAYARQHSINLGSDYSIYRTYLFYQFKILLDMFFLARVSPAEFMSRVRLEDQAKEQIQELIDSQRGACILTMHFGNWELGARLFGCFGKRVGSLYFEQLDSTLQQWFSQTRTAMGAELFHQRKGLRSSMEFLKSGGLMTIICDQDGTKNGHFIHFMNLWVSFPRSLELFVKHTKAPLIPMLLWHEGDNYCFRTYQQIAYDPDDADYEAIYSELRDWMQNILVRNPEQWLLLYDRFKLRHKPYLKEKGWLESSLLDYEKAHKGELVQPGDYR
ncbi:MAG: lysophospholipid acyltransferase family protein [Candidatus Cloacimonetes bacterium]|nr:lysophospholipid acyltransferase family protein [Candidatus Cloacimonadota bacterium]